MKTPLTLLSIVLLLFIPAVCLAAETQTLLLVADFEYSGITEQEMQLLVDLYSYTIFETGKYIVMNRYERNKLLKGFGYKQNRLNDKSAYLEAGELLQARALVTGTCFREGNTLSIALTLWDIGSVTEVCTVTRMFGDMSDLITTSRQITEELTGGKINEYQTAPKDTGETAGLSASLYLAAIRERLLIVLPDGILEPDIAAARLLTGQTAAFLLNSGRASVTFSSFAYDIGSPDYRALQKLLEKRNCHTLVLVEKKEGVISLYFYEPLENEELSGLIKLKIPLLLSANRQAEAKRIAGIIETKLPRLSPRMIARELDNENLIKAKLDMLLFNERLLSRQFFVNIHQTIFKPAIAGKYHPMLNMVGLEADAFWYYTPFFGIGGGAGFSLSYPATLDSKLSAHPLVQQYEFRLVPFSFRTGGNIGLLLNIITSVAVQNAYRVTYDELIDKYYYIDQTWLISFKTGLALGLMIHLDDTFTVFIDLVRMSAIFPFNIGTVTWDETNISGGVGGVGLILRF
ncbi:MAG: hypothetical protein JW904_02940 [Spirochaetales bacterium]|nr:hypothetical protein [Spirochaetales bacterium]